jgi:hypothetical protein
LSGKKKNQIILSTTEVSGFMVGTAVVVFLLFGTFAIFDFQSNIYIGLISTIVGLIVVSAVLALGIITVVVDPRTVTVKSTIFRMRLVKINHEEIASIHIEPFSKTYWGGWGLRLRGRDRAIVLKGKEAVVIQRKDGKKIFLAVQEAPQIAETLTSLISVGGMDER